MPLKRAQLAIFEASAKIFRTDRKRKLVLQSCGFGRLDGSKGELELERANGRLVAAVPDSATSTEELADDAFEAGRHP
jgi:hypothetical protein